MKKDTTIKTINVTIRSIKNGQNVPVRPPEISKRDIRKKPYSDISKKG